MTITKAITEVKNNLIREILNNENIMQALGSEYEVPEDLLYKNIFPTRRVPNSEVEKLTYLCIKVDANAGASRNELIKKMYITIYIITHQDLQRVTSGVARGHVRLDYISEEIENMLGRNRGIGLGETRLLSNFEEGLPTSAEHYCRILRFESNWTNKVCS